MALMRPSAGGPHAWFGNGCMIGAEDLPPEVVMLRPRNIPLSLRQHWRSYLPRRFTLFLYVISLACLFYVCSLMESTRELHEQELMYHVYERFLSDWMRVNEARFDWEGLLRPCVNSTQWTLGESWWKKPNFTDVSFTRLSRIETNPAGEFSRFVIETRNDRGEKKTVGGDTWRIHLRGPASLAPTVIDHNNGSYEVIFLPMEYGFYSVDIFLDYTLCDGLREPPKDWFVKGNAQGKGQQHGILGDEIPFINLPLWQGSPINIWIPPARLKEADIEFIHEKACRQWKRCNMVWQGLGRWVQNKWLPYCKAERGHYKRPLPGLLWMFGDSVTLRLYFAAFNHSLCSKTFYACMYSFSWIYQLENYNATEDKFVRFDWTNWTMKPFKDDRLDFDVGRVLEEFRQVLLYPDFDKGSVILLNHGLHFAENTNFSNYRHLVDGLVSMLIPGGSPFKGVPIWRTTTAINRHKYLLPYLHSHRFMTQHRVQVYNSYAMDKMCQAGIPLLDAYPLTDASPNGTGSLDNPYDAVHYSNEWMKPAEDALVDAFEIDSVPGGIGPPPMNETG